ncbi:MAG: hypothetical protein HC940_10395, partial [Acaryochloris sp. SU_5_25]|nr:hypothetical protein [Acaryochloris sp. SU_5_25]
MQVCDRRLGLSHCCLAGFLWVVSELRIHYSSGYRVYLVQRSQVVVILLCGGDKSSQDYDIKKAKELANQAFYAVVIEPLNCHKLINSLREMDLGEQLSQVIPLNHLRVQELLSNHLQQR